MRKIEIFNDSKSYLDVSGELLTPEQIREKYRLLKGQTYISETDLQDKILYGLRNLNIARLEFQIDEALNDGEAAKVIESKINTSMQSRLLPTPSERTAAALEFLVLNSL